MQGQTCRASQHASLRALPAKLVRRNCYQQRVRDAFLRRGGAPVDSVHLCRQCKAPSEHAAVCINMLWQPCSLSLSSPECGGCFNQVKLLVCIYSIILRLALPAQLGRSVLP